MHILLKALAANVIMIYSPLRREGRKPDSMITIESLVDRHRRRQKKATGWNRWLLPR
jgi:hypothetical protein